MDKFQYISCCSLSFCEDRWRYGVGMFQYISCCSLSLLNQSQLLHHKCFNTSHVVVYPASATPESANMNSFNTSHVVVYLILCIHCHFIYACFNTSHVVVYPLRNY